MSLVKFNRKRFPWINDGVTNWFDTDDFFADDFFTRKANVPAMNVKENPDNFEVELAVPGFSKNDIEVSLEDDVLHVCAENRNEEVEEDQDGYTRKEFSYQSFDRKLQIPKTVNQNEEVQATYKDGLLKLKLSKTEASVASPKRKIEIA